MPLHLKVEGRLCVLVGGGKVAIRKCRALLDHGARVRVVAPALTDDDVWREEAVDVALGVYQSTRLDGAFLAIAATDDGRINAQVERDAKAAGILVMRVDSPDDSDFIFPAWLRRGAFTLAFGTDGTAPTLATVLRDDALQSCGKEFAELCEQAVTARHKPGWRELDVNGRREAIRKLARETIPDYPWSREGDGNISGMAEIETPRYFKPGHVYLVGAGPGDPGLITVKAVECLRVATVVIHDALSNPVLLDMYCPGVKRIDVSKRKGMCQHMQPEINAMMIECALRGEVVVRLKGGDPMIFGRVGEEARALAQAGVPFDIVPGISSLSGVPAYAGIPITDREFGAHSLGIYSLHLRNGKGLSAEQWQKMAHGPDTLVLFMGMTVLSEAVGRLMDNGMVGTTPIALITQGTMEKQRQYVGTLDTIVAEIGDQRLEGPGLIVIGNVVKAAPAMAWKPVVEIEEPAALAYP